jgi:RNA polymerase sigma-70 factor (ECF subfamily)
MMTFKRHDYMMKGEMVKNQHESLVIMLAKEGHRHAFRELYERNREKIYYLAFRYVKNQQDAEDVMQETFIKAFKNIKGFKAAHQASFSSWLYKIGVNCSIEVLRKNKRRRKEMESPLSHLPKEPEAGLASPEEATVVSQTISKIKSAIHDLSPKQQIIFHLRHTKHLAIGEIANYLNCSESSIKKQLVRGLTKLKKRFNPIVEEG